MKQQYDVVIIGSGLGGLLSAVILAKEGMNVCLLERDRQIGGCLQTFSLHKTVFDSCVHYIGGLGEGHTLNRIFRYAGIMDRLQLKALDPDGFDRIAFSDEMVSYPHAVGAGRFIERLLPFFPGERQALEQYVKTVSMVGDHFPLYRLRMGNAGEKSAVSGWSLTETLRKLTGDTLLQNVLAGNNLLYAGEAERSPFYLHALVLESYMDSAHKIVPGSSQISKFLWQELQAHGGTVHRNTEVESLAEEAGRLVCAIAKDGTRYFGKQFIADIHPAALLKILPSGLMRPAYRNRISGLSQTTSAFMLNLVLKPGTVPARPYNLYWHATHDVWKGVSYRPGAWPQNYALYFTESAKYPGFAESLSVLTYMHYDEVAQWEDTQNHSGEPGERNAGYEQFKADRSGRLLEQVLRRVPELRGNIIAQSAATPLTYRDYTATPKGALYGIMKDVHRPNETTISTRTKIPNLLLTGQNVNLHGVLGVSITAIATCSELTGMEYLLGKINKGDQ